MKQKLILTAALMALTLSVSAQDAQQLKSYHFVEAQGGLRTTFGDYRLFKLTSPAVAVSYGYLTQPVGFRLHFSGWKAKSSPSYDFNYLNGNADMLLNVTHMFSRQTVRPLNIYLIGGVGMAYTFDRETPEENWKHNASLNLRVGLRADQTLSKHFGLSLEVSANNMASHAKGATYQEEKGLVAMLGINYRFGHKYNAPAITVADPVQPTMTNYQMMTSSLKEQMDTWLKQMPNETLEEYQLRISDEARAAQARKLEYEISTKMAADMLQPTEISFGDYNPVLKKLAVHATSMPDFYLDMDEKEAASLYGANNLQLKNQKYTLHPDDSFELVYAEVYNPATGKTYTFDNLQKMSLNEIRNDGNYLPLNVLSEAQMKETNLAAIMDDMVNLAKDDKVITDHTHISVNSGVETAKDASGRSIINYNVGLTYEVEEQFSSRDDFKPGRYVTKESKAAVLMLQIMKKAFEQDFNKYLAEGKQVIIKITGTADASPINRPIAYNGQYGEYPSQTVYKNGEPMNLSLTREEGIATNEQLAFARALGVKDWIEKEITDINKMQRDYKYQIEVSSQKGSKYRRINVQYTFVDAF